MPRLDAQYQSRHQCLHSHRVVGLETMKKEDREALQIVGKIMAKEGVHVLRLYGPWLVIGGVALVSAGVLTWRLIRKGNISRGKKPGDKQPG